MSVSSSGARGRGSLNFTGAWPSGFRLFHDAADSRLSLGQALFSPWHA